MIELIKLKNMMCGPWFRKKQLKKYVN